MGARAGSGATRGSHSTTSTVSSVPGGRAAYPSTWDRWVRPVAPDRPGRWWLDLWTANADQLVAAGVPRQAILSPNLCTGCRQDRFFSYRKEGLAGRLATFAALA